MTEERRPRESLPHQGSPLPRLRAAACSQNVRFEPRTIHRDAPIDISRGIDEARNKPEIQGLSGRPRQLRHLRVGAWHGVCNTKPHLAVMCRPTCRVLVRGVTKYHDPEGCPNGLGGHSA